MRRAPTRVLLAGGLVLLLALSWAALAPTGPVRLVPEGDHDGVSCRPVLEGQASDCALTLTPLFAATLVVMLAAAALALLDRRAWAAGACGLAVALVLVEWWLGRPVFAGTLSTTRALVHVAVLGGAAILLASARATRPAR